MVKQTKEELERGKEFWDWLNRTLPTGQAERDLAAANGRGDLLWIASSAALIAFGPLSAGGKWMVGAVAVVVLAFAELKMLGIRRIRQAQPRLTLRHEAA